VAIGRKLIGIVFLPSPAGGPVSGWTKRGGFRPGPRCCCDTRPAKDSESAPKNLPSRQAKETGTGKTEPGGLSIKLLGVGGGLAGGGGPRERKGLGPAWRPCARPANPPALNILTGSNRQPIAPGRGDGFRWTSVVPQIRGPQARLRRKRRRILP